MPGSHRATGPNTVAVAPVSGAGDPPRTGGLVVMVALPEIMATLFAALGRQRREDGQLDNAEVDRRACNPRPARRTALERTKHAEAEREGEQHDELWEHWKRSCNHDGYKKSDQPQPCLSPRRKPPPRFRPLHLSHLSAGSADESSAEAHDRSATSPAAPMTSQFMADASPVEVPQGCRRAAGSHSRTWFNPSRTTTFGFPAAKDRPACSSPRSEGSHPSSNRPDGSRRRARTRPSVALGAN